MEFSRNLMAGTAIVLCAVAATSAQAQEAQDTAAPTGLNEIIVTAQKRSESLQETPLAISAVTSEMIEQRGITDAASLTAIAPNISTATQPASSSNISVYIRGIGDQDPVLTSDSPIGVYVDGIVIGRSAGAIFDLVDLERIEVLRGPQGTLYGRNTIGGAINFITAKPAKTFGVSQKFTYGSFNQWQSRTSVDTGELGESGISAKLSYVHREMDGFVKNVRSGDGSKDPGALNLDAFRVALQYDKGGPFRANYSFDYNQRDGYASAFQLQEVTPLVAQFLADSVKLGGEQPVISDKRQGTLSLNNYGKLTDIVQGHNLTLEYDLSDNLTLRSLTGYRKWKNVDRGDEFDGQGSILGLAVDPVLFTTGEFIPLGVQEATFFTSTNRRHQNQISQELNLLGNIGDRFEFVVGGFYFREKSREHNPQYPGIVLPLPAPVAIAPGVEINTYFVPSFADLNYRHRSQSIAGFAQGTYKLTDALSVTGGIRYTEDKKKLTQVSPYQRTLEESFGKFNWSASLDYQINPDVLAYGRVATGYKAGGFNARSSNSGYNPEDLTSYEVGLKSELFDRRVRLNLAAFYADHKNLQLQQFQAGAGGSTSITVNAGKARYKGVEAEVQALLVKGLTVSGSFGYTDRQYKQFLIRDPATDELVDVKDTAVFPGSAATTWTASADYVWPPLPFGELALHVEYNYRGRTYFHPSTVGTPFNREISSGPRGLLDARLTLSKLDFGTGGEVTISAWGKNLLDKGYREWAIDFGGLGFAGATYGQPISAGVDLTMKF
ncbi:MAG: TonB-dependent receptor [Novosphingobium sp.]